MIYEITSNADPMANPFTVWILDGNERVSFVSDGPLSMKALADATLEYFKTAFSLMHNGAIVDTSFQVADYGVNPVFLLVRREKHARDEAEAETVAVAKQSKK